MKVTVCRKEHFNAAHRLHNPEWDDATNQKVFGKCNNPNYHGHNYDLVVHLTGSVDARTGYVIDMKVMKDIIREEVTDRYDHKNLNLDVADFKNLNPTAENIAGVIWNRLRAAFEDHLDLKITLYETERNYVEYSGN
ncbi:MAG: 6-pyruvoyl tetrahydropterin synthase family protein [Salibacteraceae bacterium]